MLTIKMKFDYSNKKAITAKFIRSFGEGAGSILSLQGGYIKKPKGSIWSDAEQIKHDWSSIGGLLRTSYEEESKKYIHLLNYDESKQGIK